MATAPKTPAAVKKAPEAPLAAEKAPVKKAPVKKVAAPESDLFAFTNFEVPTAFRDLTETTVQRSKDAYEKFKTNAEEATVALEETLEKSRANATEFNKKAIAVAQENTDATFAHFKDVFGVKTFSEAIELQSSFVKKQTEVLQNQVKEFQDLTKRITDEAVEPYKAAMQKTAESFKVA